MNYNNIYDDIPVGEEGKKFKSNCVQKNKQTSMQMVLTFANCIFHKKNAEKKIL